MNGEIYVMGRPDFGDHCFGKVEIVKHPQYVYSTSKMGMLIHKVLRVQAHWYEPRYDRLLRLENPKITCDSVCGQIFFIHLPHDDRKFRASFCEIPNPGAVLCGRCHGQPSTFAKRGNPPCSKEMAKIRKGCLQRAAAR
jgi:hypothetical protein